MEEQIRERYELALGRIRTIPEEETVAERFRDYFQTVARFLMDVHDVHEKLQGTVWGEQSFEQIAAENQKLYQDVLPEQYETSYANPAYAVSKLGEDYGQILSVLYAEMRGEIAYVYEKKDLYVTICNELFIEIYNVFEGAGEPAVEELKEILYWYASDYTDVFVADRILNTIDPKMDFAKNIIMQSDLQDLRYLYRFGEYISKNEIQLATHMNRLPEETIAKMANTYTEGYRTYFVNARKDLSKKSTVQIHYVLGFERMIRKAIENFEAMGLEPVLFRTASSMLVKGKYRNGYWGGIANPQYDYDHREDAGLVLDKKYLERKLEVTKQVYEKHKELARGMAGPAVLESFGGTPFLPVNKQEAVKYTEKQEQLLVANASKSSQLTNEYIPGDERGFTIISFPVPEIGEQFEEIFNEVIRINTLDSKLYGEIQQHIIDVLDKGQFVRVLGKAPNRTDLRIQLHALQHPEKETIFENCVADCNIPVGEVFTSPVLEGTTGTLHVSKVYLHDLEYLNLEMNFEDGMVTSYGCSNFDTAEENQKFVGTNVMFNHDTLPMGEFAIGTNTTAYAVAKKYGIGNKFTILIAEKMGPHFAIGDTCYSWSEDVPVFNPDGKEIVAKDNSCSILRKEDVSKAYFQCHTDITIPYEELDQIVVVTKDGEELPIIQGGRFVVPGTEALNKPLDELN